MQPWRSALAEVLAGLAPTYLTFVLWTPVLGLTALTMITAANATMQLGTAPMMRGRVMALYMMIFMGGTPLGAPIVGWIGETFGARWTLIGGGLGTIARRAARGGGVQPQPGDAGPRGQRPATPA